MRIRMLQDAYGADHDGQGKNYRKNHIYDLPFGPRPEPDLGRVFVEDMKVAVLVDEDGTELETEPKPRAEAAKAIRSPASKKEFRNEP